MEEDSVSNELLLSEEAKAHLLTAGKWVYIISIIGLIGAMFLIGSSIYSYISLSKWDNVSSGGGVGYLMAITLGYIFFGIGVFCFFPFYYLYKFSSNVKIAFRDDDSDALEFFFKYLKFHYMSIGILILIYLAVYFLIPRIF
ncbi:hypothetical protein GKZ90_0011350 [Flavobacterium sp. MC2016-06]|jgi:magnesium-transporting ATPase (P-type)|uniref:hypothetical protein n=1 Tax=Flavobacterium sp. MC2016-06 TaxID=2676308 RepID=UPI0012BA708C|nr:hypothetical protein [Flavobacterium sp. MC2016-06]MBU3858699.1 hypothetical protein [Flavobacterium sp. MC2016-06]